MPDASVVVFDDELRFVLVAGQAVAREGFEAESLEGRLIADVLPPDRWEVWEPIYEAALRGESNSIEIRNLEGQRWYRVDVAPWRVGEMAGGLAVARDITDRKLAQERVTGLLDSAPDAMVVVDGRGRIVLVNAQTERLFDYDRGELLGRSIDKLLPESVRAQHADHRARYVSDPYAPAQILSLLAGRRSDGSEFPAEASISPLRTDGGTLISTAIRDISERKRLEAHAAHLAAVVESSVDAIISQTLDGRIVSWNRGAERLYGYSEAEIRGRSIEILAPEDRVDEIPELLERIAAGGRAQHFETIRRRRDGSLVDVVLTMSALHAPDSRIVGVSTIARDITERKQLDDELRSSREQALEASRLKSEFVANMSHEIRTPLNGVVSMAELLLESDLSPDQREYAQVAMTSAEALMRVINDILDFSKIEAGKLEILSEDFSIRAAVDDVAEIVGVKALERGLDLDVTVDQAVADTLRGDGNRIRQVLMNLLSNAVKFTSAGRVTIRASLESDWARHEQLRLEVTDTGIGIDPERLGELFQPFSQADATTTRRYGGTGLGLCISKQLVELMGGEIGCQSSPGGGSRFWFTLPYEPGAGGQGAVADSDLTGMRVLIVEPAAAERQMLESRLASWGITPDSVDDGVDALRLLRRAADAGRPYEAALIACEMPALGGLELAEQIKAIPALRSTHLILASSTAVAPDVAKAAGIEAEVLKPLRPSRLYNQLLATIHRARGQAGATPGSQAAGGAGGPDIAGSPRVLVAEDNEVNQFAAIRLLQTLGFTVDVAKDGREAITMSGRRNYDAIFMDCQMPEVDGYTATRVIRRRERGGERTPIVALTAHALEGDREKCLAAGMDDYMAKPLRLRTIQALIERVPALRPQPQTDGNDGGDAGAGELFDPAALREIDDPQTEAALAMMFLDQAADRVPALLDAIQAPDAERVHTLAHGLKGSAATVGASRMSELARNLCELAEKSLPPAAAEVHARLADALSDTRAALDAYIAHSTTAQ